MRDVTLLQKVYKNKKGTLFIGLLCLTVFQINYLKFKIIVSIHVYTI